MVMEARMPMMTTTIRSSMMVKAGDANRLTEYDNKRKRFMIVIIVGTRNIYKLHLWHLIIKSSHEY